MPTERPPKPVIAHQTTGEQDSLDDVSFVKTGIGLQLTTVLGATCSISANAWTISSKMAVVIQEMTSSLKTCESASRRCICVQGSGRPRDLELELHRFPRIRIQALEGERPAVLVR